MSECEHRSAVYGCASCVKRVRGEMAEFPVQTQRDAKPGPLSIPWAIAERAWLSYQAQYGTQQSVERMAERGGFGWGELDMLAPGWREEVDPWCRATADLAAAQKRIAELEAVLEVKRNTCTTHAGARMACGQCHDSLRSHLAEAGRRVTELEAQVAQHPERLQETARRVAEAVREKAVEAIDEWWAERSLSKLDLAAIIAEATKP